tara:strand:+ start:146 stop:1036 length:891 start_codon:yes stop_codon:yes gene_type:complete
MARKAKGPGFSMRSGKRTTFKNMGSSLAINKSGYSNRPDGRAKSSAFQLTDDEKRKLLSDVTTMDPDVVDVQVDPNEEGGETTTTKTTRSGKNVKTYKKSHVGSWAEACRGKTSGTGTDSTGKKWDCSRKKDWKPSDEQEEVVTPIGSEDVDVKKTGKKKCECPSQQEYYGVKVGQMMTHECGKKHPACSPKETSGDDSDQDIVEDKTHSDNCKKKKNYARLKKQCVSGSGNYKPGTWDDHYCRCERKKKTSTKIKRGVGDAVDVLKDCFKVKNRTTGVWENKCVKGGGIKTSMNP